MLIPRMTQAVTGAIVNPGDGLQAYNTDDGKLYIFVLADNLWKEVQYGSGSITPPWACDNQIDDMDGNTCHFWSATQHFSEAWYRSLYYDAGGVYRNSVYMTTGLSMRCIMDNNIK